MKDGRIQFYFLAQRSRNLVAGKKDKWKPVFHHPPCHVTLREGRIHYAAILLASSVGNGPNEYMLRRVKEKEKFV